MGPMRRTLPLFFFCSLILSVAPLVSLEPEAIKLTILSKNQALNNASSECEKSQIFYDLAQAHFADQEIAKAFIHFLEALKRVEKQTPCKMCPDEEKVFETALAGYLARGSGHPEDAARELLDTYGEIAALHSDYLHLNFLIATAYANLGKYDVFFERFFAGYPYLHDSFLAHKTQGILYVRLAHLNYSFDLRNAFQKKAVHFLTAAVKRNSKDASLYKILITLAKEENNESLVRSYLKEIIAKGTPIPRGDVYFYVKEAVALGEWWIGQALIDQATLLYDYSRAVSDAQAYLNESKG